MLKVMEGGTLEPEPIITGGEKRRAKISTKCN